MGNIRTVSISFTYTLIYSLGEKKVQAFCLLQIFLSGDPEFKKTTNRAPWEKTRFLAFSLLVSSYDSFAELVYTGLWPVWGKQRAL